jgi:O-acetyl-ADP-ribose deacetylase (regulator of RNase III)
MLRITSPDDLIPTTTRIMESMPDTAVAVDALVPWADQVLQRAPPSLSNASEADGAHVFTANNSLNRTLSLWRGPIWCLRADAIVNATSESLRDVTGASGHILRAAGDQMAVECAAVAPCRTAEAVVTRGCALPARFVIHTVGPKYSARYHTAAEHALHTCYRSVLKAAKERSLRSLAIGCIYSPQKGYPREEAAHIAARTFAACHS